MCDRSNISMEDIHRSRTHSVWSEFHCRWGYHIVNIHVFVRAVLHIYTPYMASYVKDQYEHMPKWYIHPHSALPPSKNRHFDCYWPTKIASPHCQWRLEATYRSQRTNLRGCLRSDVVRAHVTSSTYYCNPARCMDKYRRRCMPLLGTPIPGWCYDWRYLQQLSSHFARPFPMQTWMTPSSSLHLLERFKGFSIRRPHT